MLDNLIAGAWSSCAAILGRSGYAPAFSGDDRWRQCFQLLTAAFIYCRGAAISLGSRVHVSSQPAETPVAWLTILPAARDATVFDGAALVDLRAGMDTASASFRITTAIELAEGSASIERTDALLGRLMKAPMAGCRLVSSSDLTPDVCRAVVVAHRDSFGHGEEGHGKPWRAERHKHFAQVCHCRIVEAQLREIELGMRRLLAALP